MKYKLKGQDPFKPPETLQDDFVQDEYKVTLFDKALSILMCLMAGIVASGISYSFCFLGLNNPLATLLGLSKEIVNNILFCLHLLLAFYVIPRVLYKYAMKASTTK
ncbi:hypothetical protein LNTAR_10701 [Lentisphaera araneosa HTCC2155]|uniref:Uncharacterized protein n=1 Tax=Lentisphaera araneosa HTCC2155 TaxID=313628 RepID=A6DIU3_9BACT|nr:hypothetical protein [Lentisphaera araneosa]EDM28379.1 hypothetical protein LNTAR_10701 [Lentisphaera araneosa HTCC2155]